MVADELLVDVKHWQQDVKQVPCRGSRDGKSEDEIAPGLWHIGPPREAMCEVQTSTERSHLGGYADT